MTMSTPTCAAAVANAFLEIQEKDGSQFPPIDQMKLQKLVYYAHAWWLANTGDSLFEDDIEAWPWGPVVPDLYYRFRDFGRQPIVGQRAVVLESTGNNSYAWAEPEPVSPEVKEYLEGVWESHKHLSGIQLSNATHLPGEPWTIVKDKHGHLDLKPRIPNSLIREVFKKKMPVPEEASLF